ncbi:MAG: cyclodeaminase/cyclohydrolase family protein [Anaerolineae bacterium]
MSNEAATSFLDALASKSPTPGGGAASAYAGAMAAALTVMVARTTLGKKAYAGVEARMRAIIDEAEAHRAALTDAVMLDGAAYEALLAARRTGDTQVVERAVHHAAEVPLQTAETALRVLALAIETAETGNRNATSDACAAANLAHSAASASLLNVKVNSSEMEDRTEADRLATRANELLERADALWVRLPALAQERLGVD